ncbi:hypothetical protein NDU88_008592 [Pleurodeles waltl]|uniref:Uncharacterized protein n=1 Tax=Pleurodeles waltl TaxID=8319 RepID=A0AAV7QV52_PLEWA|nr:hypothetical protein NDU88_008592 [Pleurodeles waltl]
MAQPGEPCVAWQPPNKEKVWFSVSILKMVRDPSDTSQRRSRVAIQLTMVWRNWKALPLNEVEDTEVPSIGGLSCVRSRSKQHDDKSLDYDEVDGDEVEIEEGEVVEIRDNFDKLESEELQWWNRSLSEPLLP